MVASCLTLQDLHGQDAAVCRPLLVDHRQPEPVGSCLQACYRGNGPVGPVQLQPRRSAEEETVSHGTEEQEEELSVT